jgi:flagellar basal body-associated protein FliL
VFILLIGTKDAQDKSQLRGSFKYVSPPPPQAVIIFIIIIIIVIIIIIIIIVVITFLQGIYNYTLPMK